MGTECFRELGVDPFKTYTPSELDHIVSEKKSEYEVLKSKAQTVPEKNKIGRELDALPGYRKDLADAGCRSKAQEEVLAIVTKDLERHLFHRIDGSSVFFEKQIDDILEPARKKNWNVGPEVVGHIKGASLVSESDFKDIPADNAFNILKLLGTDDIVSWTNGAISKLYSEGSDKVPAKVSAETSFPTFKSTIMTLAARAQKFQKNSHYPDAEKYSALLKKVTPMFMNEASYTKFRTAMVMYSVEEELQSSTTSMDFQSISSLINTKVAGRGVDVNDALRELERFCLSKGIVADFSKVTKECTVCGFCGCRFEADKETNFCPYCNKPIAIDCPRCGVRNPSSNLHCKGCGIDFSLISNLPFIEKGLKEDIRNGNLLSVKETLAKFEGYEDFVDKSLLKEADGFLKDTEALFEELDSMEAAKRYCAALERCDEYLRGHSAFDEISDRRAEYAAIVDDIGKRFRAVPAGSSDRYIALVGECSDHPDLIRYFNSNRPPSPTDVTVSQNEDGHVLVSMGSLPPKDASYLLVRKEGSSPLNENDGVQVAETKDKAYVDRSISFGVEYRYAVYAKRWGVTSTSAALSKPIAVFADVIDASASPSEAGIRLDYKVPKGCSKVLVYRSEGSEPSASGVPYADNGTKGFFVDKDAQDDSTTYSYRIVAEYSQKRAIPMRTKGVVVSCKPMSPPDPISDLSVKFAGGRFSVGCTSEEDYELYFSKDAADIGMSTCTVADLAHSAEHIEGIMKSVEGVRSFTLPPGAVGKVYPVVTIGGTAIIGNGVHVSMLEDVSDIRTVMDGDVCSLTFKWPKDCGMAKVVMRSDRYPADASDGEDDVTIMQERYIRDGNFRFKVPFQRTYATVYAQYGSKGNSQGSSMMLSSRQNLPEIRYSFSYSFLGRKCTCKISVSDDIDALPAMVLRGFDRSMPTKSSIGKTLEEIPAQELRGFNLAVPVGAPAKNMKLFFVDADDNRRYRLIHPV